MRTKNVLLIMLVVAFAGLAACAPKGPAATPTSSPPQATEKASPPSAQETPVAEATNPVGELPPPAAGHILYMGPVNSAMQVWVMNADGSGRRPITKEPGENAFASFSADGQQIVFTSTRDRNLELYVAGADGSEAVRLTNNPAQDNLAAWSPDGTQVAFSSDRDGDQPDLYVLNRSDKKVTRLTTDPAADLVGGWSPDGKLLVFGSDRDGDQEIFTVSIEGGDPVQITHNDATDGAPTWSPDGKMIAFHSNRDGNSEIYVMSADGSNPERLTNSPEDDIFPVWSPDGKWLAYTAQRANRLEIHIIELATRADAVIPDVIGLATDWVASDEVLADVPLPTPKPVPPTATSPPMEGNEVSPDVLARAPMEGDPKAPVEIVEFSDYQCPYCKAFFDETLPQIREKYISTGKVKLIFVDYPLSFHEQASLAAQAAWCAGDQDVYWKMHNKLFGHADEWAGKKDAESVMIAFAEDLGLDKGRFQSCLEARPHADEVKAGLAEGERLAVNGTPTFFVNGRRVVGAQPFDTFRTIIEQELAKAK